MTFTRCIVSNTEPCDEFHDWKLLFISTWNSDTLGELGRRRRQRRFKSCKSICGVCVCVEGKKVKQTAHDISTKRKRRMTHSDGSFFFCFFFRCSFFCCSLCVEGNRRSKHFEQCLHFLFSLWLYGFVF